MYKLRKVFEKRIIDNFYEYNLLDNKNAIQLLDKLLENNIDAIDLHTFMRKINSDIIHLIKFKINEINNIYWYTLFIKPFYYIKKIIEKYIILYYILIDINKINKINKITFFELLKNILYKNNWKYLLNNKNLINLLLKIFLDEYDWSVLSKKTNLIYLLENNLDKVDWKFLSLNPNAIY